MKTLASCIMALVALVNLSPVVGVLSASWLERLYGETITTPAALILMRHRAAMFGILGAIMLAGSAWASWRPAGYVAGFSSMVSFIVIAASSAHGNEAIRRIMFVDVIAVLLLILALCMDMAHTSSRLSF